MGSTHARGVLLLVCGLFMQRMQTGKLTVNGSLTLSGSAPSTSRLERKQMADQQPGADACAKLSAAHANLPATGGIIDGRGFQGSLATCAGGVSFTKPVILLWGASTLNCSTAAVCMSFSGNGSRISGIPGASQFTEVTAGTNVVVATSVSDFEVTGVTFVGTGGTGISLSLDNAIKCICCRRVKIHGNVFTAFLGYAFHAQQGTDLYFDHNQTFSNTGGVLFRGSSRTHARRNTFRDPQSGTVTFTTAIQNDSSSSTFGIVRNFEYSRNIFRNYADGQAILIHSGQTGRVSGNVCENVLWCIAVDSFQVGDTLDRIVISGNTATHPASGTNQSGGADPNYSIEGLSGQVATNITFVKNLGSNGNYETAADNQGCVSIQWTDGLVMTNNTMKACKGSCYTFNNGNSTRMAVKHNSCLGMVGSQGAIRVGFYVTAGTGLSGQWSRNTVDNATSCYRADVATSIFLKTNADACTNTTEIIHSPGNFNWGGSRKR